jgi:putative spermidine/putrescine transport system permease protein/spermidine/putrescine transport system permease protein
MTHSAVHRGPILLQDHADALLADERRENRLFILLILPALLIMLAIMLLPLLWLVWQSFLDKSGGLTIQHYASLFSEPSRLTYLTNTFTMAAEVTAISIVLAYPVAYALSILPARISSWCMILVIGPLLTSVLVRTYAWLVILGRTGILNHTLIDLGLIDRPYPLVYNYTGTLIGMVHVMLPMVVLPLYGAMQSVDPDLNKAAASLGASPTRAFFTVFLPLSSPGLVAGAILVFVLSLGYYVTPTILGGGKVGLWAIFIEQTVSFNPLWGPAAAAGILLLLITLAVLLIARVVAGVNLSGLVR